MQNPLKASPLGIEFHALTSMHVNASQLKEPTWNHFIRTRRQVEQLANDDLRWIVELTVEFGTSENCEEAAYSGSISVVGHFLISEEFPAEKRNTLIEVTAVSILYGTCRETLANFTARSVHGILSIPSVAFEPIRREQKPDQKTPGKRVAKKAGKSAKD